MMTKCPMCGSAEIVTELPVFAGNSGSAIGGPYVVVDPPKGQNGDPVVIRFRVDVCGSCGYAEMYTRFAAQLLEAHKKGYVKRA